MPKVTKKKSIEKTRKSQSVGTTDLLSEAQSVKLFRVFAREWPVRGLYAELDFFFGSFLLDHAKRKDQKKELKKELKEVFGRCQKDQRNIVHI